MYSFYKEYKGCFYLFPSGADGLLIIDGNEWSIRTLDYVINDELQRQIQAECKDNFKNEMLSGIVSENVEYDETLGDFWILLHKIAQTKMLVRRLIMETKYIRMLKSIFLRIEKGYKNVLWKILSTRLKSSESCS